MQIFRHLIIAALILYLVTPEVEGGWFKRTFRKIGRGIRKGVKKVGKAIKKVGCKVRTVYLFTSYIYYAGCIQIDVDILHMFYLKMSRNCKY